MLLGLIKNSTRTCTTARGGVLGRARILSSRSVPGNNNTKINTVSPASDLLSRAGGAGAGAGVDNLRHFSSSSAEQEEDSNIMTTPPLKPWPKSIIEADGDYRNETYLEKHIGGPLYEYQSSLPRLPIPTIEETITKFLPTALPLCPDDTSIKNLEKDVASFPNQATNLQELLLQRRNEEGGGGYTDSSWLQKWWNQLGYLQVRDSVVINVSYFFHLSDDTTLPSIDPTTISSNPVQGIARGCTILTAVAEHRLRVITGQFPQETIGKKKTPLCSTAFKYMFNGCRIPQRKQDSYLMYDPSLYKHCIVARKGQFYVMDFIDNDGLPLDYHVLQSNLEDIVRKADDDDNNNNGAKDMMELGWLTSNDRDTWADDRDELLRVGGKKMEEALEVLQSAAFILNLDDEEPLSRKQCGELFLHGGADMSKSGGNRWYDKTIQMFCTNNGKAGFLGEHSMLDGMPMVSLADHVARTTTADVSTRRPRGSGGTGGGVRNVFGDVMEDLERGGIRSRIEAAKETLMKTITNHDLHVQSFQGYGSSHIKTMGYSPDAFVQMAIQLATYRLFAHQAGTYEAVQTRVFLHGRTETCRSVSTASQAFVERMGYHPREVGDTFASQEKVALLQKAADAQVQYIGQAAKGLGVDRHFLGLAMIASENPEATIPPGGNPPDLLSNPTFQYSKRWRVSTSHLTHPKFENWGFGEVYPDGVGVGYSVKDDCCVFNVTARKEHGWTERLSHLLEEALLEMKELHGTIVKRGGGPKSKL